MIIKSLKMVHFGKFSGKEAEFRDGLNLIEGGNEAGKSTMHAFIRGMFFGIDKNRGRAGKGDIYTRYLPWETPGAYQGSLDFENEGKEYRISRVFLQNAKSLDAYEIATGRKLEMGEEGITAVIPGLTPSVFDNTVSCLQQQIKSKEDFGSYIKSYIANMAGAGEAEVDVTKALELLDGKAGKIQKDLKKVDVEAIEEELKSFLEDEKDENYMLEDRDRILGEVNDLETRMRSGADSETEAAMRRDYEELLGLSVKASELEKTRAEAGNVEEKLRIAEENTAKLKEALEAKRQEAGKIRERLDAMGSELETAREKVSEAKTGSDGAREKAGAAKDAQKETANAFEVLREKVHKLTTASLVMILAGAGAAVVCSEKLKAGIIAGIVVMLAGLVAALFTAIASKEKKKAQILAGEAEKAAEEAEKEAAESDREFEELSIAEDRLKDEHRECELKLKDVDAACRETEVGLKNCSERESDLSERGRSLKESLDREETTIRARLGEIAVQNAMYGGEIAGDISEGGISEARIKDICGRFAARIEAGSNARRELDAALAEKKNELARIEGALQQYGDIGARIEETAKRLEEAKAAKDKLNDDMSAVKYAARCIKETADDLKGNFDRHINGLLSKACEQITAGTYREVRLNDKCEPEVMTQAGYVPVTSLSTGTMEQIFLAFRLAIEELIFGDTAVPMIFDEIFAYYDDDRLRSALEALSRLKNRQVLLFVCSPRERAMLDDMGIAYNSVILKG